MTESENEDSLKNLSEFSEPDANKIDKYLLQIRELEKIFVKLEKLPQFDQKYKKNKSFLEKLELPKPPTRTTATKL